MICPTCNTSDNIINLKINIKSPEGAKLNKCMNCYKNFKYVPSMKTYTSTDDKHHSTDNKHHSTDDKHPSTDDNDKLF